MSTFTFTTQMWPDGTEVSVYGTGGFDSFPTNGPPGPALATAEVLVSQLTFTGLEQDVPYFAAAKVDGEWRGTRFTIASRPPAVVLTRDLASGELFTQRGESLSVVSNVGEFASSAVLVEERERAEAAEAEALAAAEAAVIPPAQRVGFANYDTVTKKWQERPACGKCIYTANVSKAEAGEPADGEPGDLVEYAE